MQSDTITIRFADGTALECRCAIVIPDCVLTQAGRIKTMTADSTAHAKHQFHALTQIALYQFQEAELEVEDARGPLTVRWRSETESVTAGIVLCLDTHDELHLVGNSQGDVGKLLQVAHRTCTRWIRLDV